MLDVVLPVAGGDVVAAEGRVALGADEIETAKVVTLAEQLLTVGRVDGEELMCNDVVAVHALEAVQVEHRAQCPHERAGHHLAACRAYSANMSSVNIRCKDIVIRK